MTSVAELKVPFIFVIPLQEYYPPPPPVPAPPPAQMGRAQPANQVVLFVRLTNLSVYYPPTVTKTHLNA